MFKHLLFRGIQDTFKIFTDSCTPPPSQILPLVYAINAQAQPIWLNSSIIPSVRESRCEELFRPVLDLNGPKKEDSFEEMTPEILEHVNKIFMKHYGSSDAMLLMGRTDKEAYSVQTEYASEIADLLGFISHRHKSRAIIYLGPIYGRSSILLLCESSVTWLWKLCQSKYYAKQISLVSCAHLPPKLPPADPQCSSTGGSNPLPAFQRCRASAATTCPASIGF